MYNLLLRFIFFFFNDTATTEIYTLSLHDALPISACGRQPDAGAWLGYQRVAERRDRKSTRLNSSHSQNSYAVFCLKNKKKTKETNKLSTKRISETFASGIINPK